VQSNLPSSWLTEGDGIVAYESQQIFNVPGVPSGSRIWYIDLTQRTSHVDETLRTGSIKAVLDKLESELDSMADPPGTLGVVSPDSPIASEEVHPEADLSRAREGLAEFRSQHGDRYKAELNRAEELAAGAQFSRLYQLGGEVLPRQARPEDPATQLALKLLTLSGTKKGVAKILDTVSRDSGWQADDARKIGAELAFAADGAASEVLSAALFRGDPRDPAVEAAAEALLRSRSGKGVQVLLDHAAGLSEPEAIRTAVNRIARIGSTRSALALRKLLPTVKFASEETRLALERVAADLERSMQVQSARKP
jgi:hypothetical protein